MRTVGLYDKVSGRLLATDEAWTEVGWRDSVKDSDFEVRVVSGIPPLTLAECDALVDSSASAS